MNAPLNNLPQSAPPPAAPQRSIGNASVQMGRVNGQARLRDLHQSGSAKAILPHQHKPPPTGPEVVFLNTSGGLTGGDHLTYALKTGADVRVTATTQTAERAYRSLHGAAQMDVSLRVDDGGHLDWLPQETILFNHANLKRKTRIDLFGTATCLCVETIILGRFAMGESLTHLSLLDQREIWRDNRPILLDPLRITGATLTAGPAALGAARAMASVAMITPDAGDILAALRAELTDPDCSAFASAFDGKLTIRITALDGMPLRRQLIRILDILRPGALPRVWQI
ncbi:urease accessory protein UreD [Aestuariibius sp. HNIBRBA575]|uniref:urease accessory protein UreD n=1 Tax=Aestuariibius sp. HNIBRBA575 TaxID=3233343 RepID=UPI0034A382A4